MGICRDSRHKRRATGGKRFNDRKKRKFELGDRRPTRRSASRRSPRSARAAATKSSARCASSRATTPGARRSARARPVFWTWSTTPNNELVRTKTLVKNAIVQVDATPFRQWYEAHYGVKIGLKKRGKKKDGDDADVKKSS